jgi:DNA-binding LacI/PurR family transcriptional regulator
MPKKLTMRDLARAAKVSPATVSRIIAGNSSVDPEIRKQVHKVAQKLGFDLESKRKGKSRVMAFLLANRDVLHSFQARVLLGAEAYCAQHQWELLFMSFHYSPETAPEALHLPQLLSPQTNARAVILGGTNHPNLLAALEAKGLPFAVLGNNVIGAWPENRCDAAYSDDIMGAREATSYLISKGHRAIGFLGNLQLPWFRRCASGYEEAMKTARLASRCVDLRSDGSQLGYLATKALLSQHPDTTAILAGSDQVATGVYDALREANLRVPAQISVIGFNDTQGEMLYPPLTSVREFPEELGRHLAEFVLGRLRNPSVPRQHLTVPTQLVLRGSVAARG